MSSWNGCLKSFVNWCERRWKIIQGLSSSSNCWKKIGISEQDLARLSTEEATAGASGTRTKKETEEQIYVFTAARCAWKPWRWRQAILSRIALGFVDQPGWVWLIIRNIRIKRVKRYIGCKVMYFILSIIYPITPSSLINYSKRLVNEGKSYESVLFKCKRPSVQLGYN